ncbi:MAG: hypothetical protein JNK02_12350 [Planctomycetes bacterium]|nr:hypothetical protein [Planctomycetota bacterium]
MKPDVLEHNVARLFAQSWRPVTPSARFASALRARLEDELRAQATRRAPLRRAGWSRPARVAASILVLLAGWIAAWFLGRDARPAPGPEELVGRGQIALLERGAWRAAAPREIDRGLEAGDGAAQVRTPAGLGLTVHAGGSGRVVLGAASALSLAPRAADGGRALELGGHEARVRRDDAGAPWQVAVPGGAIALERGILAWRAASGGPPGAVGVVELESGRAHVLDEAGTPLTPGLRVWLAEGRIAAASVALGSQPARGSERRPAPVEAQAGASAPAELPAPATAALSGSLTVPAGATAPARFHVSLLRRVRLPEVSQPERREFAGTLSFTLEGLRPGSYEVLVEAPGFAVARRTDVEILPAGPTSIEFALAAERVVRGRVVDAQDRGPLAGAVVLVEELVPAQVVPFDVDAATAAWLSCAVTEADGSFTLPGLGAAPATLRVSAAGRAARWIPVSATPAELELAEIELGPGGAVQGRVARGDGSPWSGALVIASRMGAGVFGERMSFGLTRSDAAGRYALTDLPPGGYVVFAYDPAERVTPATRDLTIRGTEVVEKDLGPTEGRTRVVGIARGPQGAPLADLDVLLGSDGPGSAYGTAWISARTDRAGAFAFEGVEPRRYEVFAGRGLGTSYARVGELDVPLAPEIRHDLELAPGAVHGTVRAIDGAPAAEAWIILLRVDGARETFAGRAHSDLAGRFELLGLAPGTYVITAHAERAGVAAVRSAPIEVGAGPSSAELRFVPGVELLVRVVDAQGAPRAGARVRCLDAAGLEWQFTASALTDARGLLHVPGAAPGRWRIAVEGGTERVLDLELGARLEVELRADRKEPPGTPATTDQDGGGR